MNQVIYCVIVFATCVVLKVAESTVRVLLIRGLDVTDKVAGQLSPPVKYALQECKLRILSSTSGVPRVIAQYIVSFPRSVMVVDYQLQSGNLQDFIIAHELAHHRRKDPWWTLCAEACILSLIGFEVITLIDDGFRFNAALYVFVPTAIAGAFATVYLRRRMRLCQEFAADASAAQLIGHDQAEEALKQLLALCFRIGVYREERLTDIRRRISELSRRPSTA